MNATDAWPRRSGSLKRLTAYDTTGTSSRRSRIESDSLSYVPADSVVHARAGLNRFVWDLRLPGVRPVRDIVNDEGTYAGAMVVPGAYAVRVTANGQTQTQNFQVADDPRVGASAAELAATFDLTKRTVDKINEVADEVRRIQSMQEQLDARSAQTRGQPYGARVAAAANPLRDRLEAIKAELIEVHSHTSQITLHYPVKLYNQLLNVNRMAQSFDRGPTSQSVQVLQDLAGKVDAQLARLRALEGSDLGAFNRLLEELRVPAVTVREVRPIS